MSAAWLDSANPAMQEWGLESSDLYGGVIVVDLAASAARLAVTADLRDFTAVVSLDDLDDRLGQLAE